ncbi:MAG: HEAT repeat domain-containing protein [Candidatus Hydrogenedentales bacterium]|jgi:HEAT repeat protein
MRNILMPLILAGVLTLACISPAMAQTTDPVAVLNSDAAIWEKSEACRALALKGGPESVPALAALLIDEKMSHMARMALEAMPCPEAGDALRAALTATNGALKVGVIGSVAARKDKEGVPALEALLSDADAEVAMAAARGLGKIATGKAVKALTSSVAEANVPPLVLQARCDGLLGCAEAFIQQGKAEKASAIYDSLRALPGASIEVRGAALRGAALSQSPELGAPLLVETLKGEDLALANIALRTSREIAGGDDVSAVLAGALSALPDDRKILLLAVLGYRGGAAAGPAMVTQAESGATEVRVAAIKAIAQIGYEPGLAAIQALVMSDDELLAKTARESLSYFPGAAGDAAINAMLTNEQAATRKVAVEMISRGGLEKPVEVLMKTAQADADEGVRVAALDALKDQVGIGEMPGLLTLLLGSRSTAETQAAESVLAALCIRAKEQSAGEVVIQKAVYGALPDGPSADVAVKVKEYVDSGSGSVAATNAVFGDTAPNKVKQLQVVFTENGVTVDRTVNEGETLRLSASAAPPAVVDALCTAFESAPAPVKPSVLRLLGTTASPKALEVVKAAAGSAEAEVKQTAEQVLSKWQG